MKIFLFWLCILLITACSPTQSPRVAGSDLSAAPADLPATAAAEATAIIQQAQATALVLQAQAQADVLLQQSQSGWLGEESEIIDSAPDPERVKRLPTQQPFALPSVEGTPSQVSDSTPVLIIKVELGGDGGFIVVNYLSTYQAAQSFWPGRVSVTDEATGVTYNEVPVMPVIGPLLARPQTDGQPGYVMFVNNPPILVGTKVTVVLDTYRQEHIPVQ